jgi:hypothetical protein
MLPESPLRNDGLTQVCAVYRRPFPRSGRRVFCSTACRQAAWRRRHPTPLPSVPPPVPPRVPRPSTVYQCPECDNRYLGEQYCSDCARFCRRVGAGGLCPACEEPVAIIDRVPEATESTTHPHADRTRVPSAVATRFSLTGGTAPTRELR